MNSIKIFLFFSLIFSPIFSSAASDSEFVVNDKLKKCAIYVPQNQKELKAGWRIAGYPDFNNYKDYCESLGYQYDSSFRVDKTLVKYNIVEYLSQILFLVLIFIWYKILIPTRKKYFLFIILVLTTFMIVSIIHEFLNNYLMYGTFELWPLRA